VASYSFDGKNQEAQNQAREQGARMVVEVSDETRAAINALMAKGIGEGFPPRQTAFWIRETVGLTSRQAVAVANYQARLQVRGGLKPSQITDKTRRYAAKKLRERADTIARTETMGALNRGKLVAARDAQAKGLFNDPIKRWVLARDEKTCPLCAPLENEQVPLDDNFSNGYSAPPRHPRCRCTITVTEGEALASSLEDRPATGPTEAPVEPSPVAPPLANRKPTEEPWKINTYSEGAQARLNALAHDLERDFGMTVRFADRGRLEGHLKVAHSTMGDHNAVVFAEQMVENGLKIHLDGLNQIKAAGVNLTSHRGSVFVQGWRGTDYAWAGRGVPSKWAQAMGDFANSQYFDEARFPGGKAATRQIHFQNLSITSSYFPASGRATHGLGAFPWEDHANNGGFFPFYHPEVQAAMARKWTAEHYIQKAVPGNLSRTPIHETGHMLHTPKWDHGAENYIKDPAVNWTRITFTSSDAGGFGILWRDFKVAARRGDLGPDYMAATDTQLASVWDVDLGRISGYGSTGPGEWVAEAFTHQVGGNALTPVQSWAYNALKGPAVGH